MTSLQNDPYKAHQLSVPNAEDVTCIAKKFTNAFEATSNELGSTRKNHNAIYG